ncbi:MAG TPA: Rieske (2Fe-2S) protein [Longimicrobiales bacterium]|nr:Rieske (2Fe-2S) protein [Longimicrobiales bacterium]
MLRRDFVQRLPLVTSGVLLGASSLSLAACAGAPYLVPRTSPGRLVVGGAELGPNGQAFVQGPGMERPVYVRRLDSGELVAVLASCTHQGCQPEPVADRLTCPCHGSEFSFDGAVLQGPAERPLTRYPVAIEGEDIVVRVGAGFS